MSDHKALTRVEVKDADKGEVVAVFATLEVVDLDNDYTVKGAFEDGAAVRISAYGHMSWQGMLPVGKGTIREVGKEAVMEGRFFLDNADAASTFNVVKELGDLQEWSYGFDPVEYSFGEIDDKPVRFLQKLKVHEVSPVLLGAAGPGRTRTLAAKSALKFDTHAESVLAEIDELIERFPEVITFRTTQGKSRLSEHSVEFLARVEARLKQLIAFRDEPPSTDDNSDDELERIYAQFVALNTQGA